MAQDFLESLGYIIMEANWRFKRAEIDLIAKDGDEIVFVEVKRRSANDHGYPEEYVTYAKARHLRRAIEGYLSTHAHVMHNCAIRIDIIAITDYPREIVHLKAVDLP